MRSEFIFYLKYESAISSCIYIWTKTVKENGNSCPKHVYFEILNKTNYLQWFWRSM